MHRWPNAAGVSPRAANADAHRHPHVSATTSAATARRPGRRWYSCAKLRHRHKHLTTRALHGVRTNVLKPAMPTRIPSIRAAFDATRISDDRPPAYPALVGWMRSFVNVLRTCQREALLQTEAPMALPPGSEARPCSFLSAADPGATGRHKRTARH